MSARASATQDRPWIAGLIGRTASGETSPVSQIDTRNYNGLVTTLRCLANARLSTGSKVHDARMSSPCRCGDIAAVTRKAIARRFGLTGTHPALFCHGDPPAARPSWPVAELGSRRPCRLVSWVAANSALHAESKRGPRAYTQEAHRSRSVASMERPRIGCGIPRTAKGRHDFN